MTILENPWFLALLASLSVGLLYGMRLKRPRPIPPACLVAFAPLVLALAGLWNRHAGLREDFELTIERYLPAAVELDQLPALPSEAKDPDVMMVMLGVGAPQPLLGFLHAHGAVGFRREEPQGRFSVMYREALDPALLAELKPRPPRSQRLVAKLAKESREIPVEPGGMFELGGGTFRVVALYPDFEVRPDAQGRPTMGSRSQESRDPWLELEYGQPGKPPRRVLLSAFQPELTQRLNAANLPDGLTLNYLREGEERQSRFVVFSRNDQRVHLVENGVVSRSEATAIQRPFVVAPGLSLTALGFYDRFYPAPSVASGLSAVRMKVLDRQRGAVQRAWLRPNDPAQSFVFENKVGLKLLPPTPNSKALHFQAQVMDAHGAAWAPQEVTWANPQGGALSLHLQRRPAEWLGWTALGMVGVGTVGWLWGRRRQLGAAETERQK